jgi:CHAT domain-containing protein
VNDASTAELMGALFGALARERRATGVVDHAALVRDAKRSLRKNAATEAPFHWAPFVLSGVR